jgi:hypothetical protein
MNLRLVGRAGRIIEIKSPLILQPGPAALSDGLGTIAAALETLSERFSDDPRESLCRDLQARQCDGLLPRLRADW